MPQPDWTKDETSLWRRCELAWAQWLSDADYLVTHLTDATNNTPDSAAPLTQTKSGKIRTPDLLAAKAGVSEYWEVKVRSGATVDPLTGLREHWMPYAAFVDYRKTALAGGQRVWVILFEAPTSCSSARWLQAEIRSIGELGHRGRAFGHDGSEMDAWFWPVSTMKVVLGPVVEVAPMTEPVLPPEGEAPPIPIAFLEPAERTLRRRRTDWRGESPGRDPDGEPTPAERVMGSQHRAGLDVLRRTLGIPAMPEYSVLRVIKSGQDAGELLGLLDYGIRVFLITDINLNLPMTSELLAYTQARLFSWARLDRSLPEDHWIVDGQFPMEGAEQINGLLDAADDAGDINVEQYRIVHAPTDADVVVVAGAGTGKTETMSERVVFLLATDPHRVDAQGDALPGLRADDIVLMTFTREAAAEMRNRIARTLMIRQRIAPRCVLPALAWMLQLSGAEISTIHGVARGIVGSGAAALGISPGFRVSAQTLEFRALVNEALSARLQVLYDKHGRVLPPAYQWQRHIEHVWEAFQNNGVDFFRADTTGIEVEWGTQPPGLQGEAALVVREALNDIAGRFRGFCVDSQSLPTNQLVPVALHCLRLDDAPPSKRPRFVFVDEFQDTDPLQMDLILEMRERFGASLFVVGDAKQGIYRFRGAEGNAFAELEERMKRNGLPAMRTFPLTRNFRSGGRLLEILHRFFMVWGQANLLAYNASDKLRARSGTDQLGMLVKHEVPKAEFASEAARFVQRWRAEHGRNETIAVLCRRNSHAIEVQTEIRKLKMNCELLVGGSFFRTPAVRELRVLMEAVARPSDDAALLELCETRWARMILTGPAPEGVLLSSWGEESLIITDWHGRLAPLATLQRISRDDLNSLRSRVVALGALLSRIGTLPWVIECARVLRPECFEFPDVDDDETERRRYSRCMDHLITKLDETFGASPASLERVLAWLRLQIATNYLEDEPQDVDQHQGRITALTVHKAKGLEFDRVLIPHTWTGFGAPPSVETEVAVVRQPDEKPRVAWKWKWGNKYDPVYVSASDVEASIWTVDEMETRREETRLLYVAMTRAKEELAYFTSNKGRAPDDTWMRLIHDVIGGA